MKINKNSWHYRVYAHNRLECHIPITTNLCEYCTKVFRIIFWRVIIGVAIGCVGGLAYYAIYKYPQKALAALWVIAAIAIACVVAVFILFFFFMGYAVATRRWKESKNPNVLLIRAWYQAKKQKLCPRVEFK